MSVRLLMIKNDNEGCKNNGSKRNNGKRAAEFFC
jgi:hypothetical protein